MKTFLLRMEQKTDFWRSPEKRKRVSQSEKPDEYFRLGV